MEVCDLCRKAATKGPGKDMYKVYCASSFGGDNKEFGIHFAHTNTMTAMLRPNGKLICGTCLKKMGLLELLEQEKITNEKRKKINKEEC